MSSQGNATTGSGGTRDYGRRRMATRPPGRARRPGVRLFRFATASAIMAFAYAGVSAAPASGFTKVVFASPTADLADFERFAVRAKESGATHITITAEDLPWSFWQYDTPDDPYPTWVISNPGLLKIAPPAAIRPHVSLEYAERVMNILEARGAVLRRLGLKAAFHTFEPQMLPEALFEERPLWRGPRVDHPQRSRVARFAPSIDHPEVLALYEEAVANLLRRCPEIELLAMRTNDSGAGVDWSRGLYSGRSGYTAHRSRPMEQRIGGFFAALQRGAKAAGGSLELELYNTKELDRARLATALSHGMAVDNTEGPEATPYKAAVDTVLVYNNFFHPVAGIPQIVAFIDDLQRTASVGAPRLFISIPDRVNRELYFRAGEAFGKRPFAGEMGRLHLLRELAVAEAGERDADKLVAIWLSLHEAQKVGGLLTSGAAIVYGGCILQRWLTRPLVPFPHELPPEEKAYYRRFILQARSDAHADTLTDLQATELYSGWSGYYFVNRIIGEAESSLGRAQVLARSMRGADSAAMLAHRIEVFRRMLRTARHAVSYQAQLDRVRELGIKPELRPVPQTQPSWDRQMMLETARAEIDNIAELIELLGSTPGDYIELAAEPEEEDIRVLGPDLIPQLRMKIKIMNARWRDYDRIFTAPMIGAPPRG
jgi:hypothetical protein